MELTNYMVETPYEFTGDFEPLLKRSYEPAAFQKHACKALNEGNSVLVCAHTGSGKTYVSDHAVELARKMGKKYY